MSAQNLQDFYATMAPIGIEYDEKNVIKNVDIGVDKKPQYPSEWFDKATNEGKKPPIYIMTIKKEDERGFIIHCVDSFWKKTIQCEEAVAFLHLISIQHPGTLVDKWVSFKREIGQPNDKITIENIVEIKRDPENVWKTLVNNEAVIPSQGYVVATAIAMCAVYRVCQNGMDDYIEMICKRVDELIRSHYNTSANISSIKSSFKHWIENPSYTSMMAALDMFLFEFPLHSLSHLRIGTMLSRNKDCSALLSIHYICKSMSVKTGDFTAWLLNKNISDEYRRVMANGQEMEDPRSYARYFMDLKCSNKSPYSATVNANLHTFIHIIGCVLMSERSRNARQVGTPDFGACYTAGCLIGYIFMTGQDYKPTHGPKGIDECAGRAGGTTAISKSNPPTGRDPREWRHYLSLIKYVIPHFIIEAASRKIDGDFEPRDGTIGKKARDNALTILDP